MALGGGASGGDFDSAVLRGSNGFEPAGPVYAADVAGPSYPADVPIGPAPYVAPALSEFRVEVGARYWYSSAGSFAKNLFDDPRFSNNLNSRLTYSSLSGRSYEMFGRIDHASGFFLKGYVGLGTIGNGSLTDEDFPPAAIQYSNTLSDQRNGRLGYVNVDYGYNFWTGPGYRVGAFAGYHYMQESLNAYGCIQTAGSNPLFLDCIPAIPGTTLGITEAAGWHSIRLGIAADVLLFERLRLGIDAAWVPYTRMIATDTHWLRADLAPVPEQGSGSGVQLEAFAAYQLTEAWSLGVGARYWRMQASGNIDLESAICMRLNCAAFSLVPVSQPGTFTTDRYGVFAQGSYRFGLD
jgi:hypothetical protein